MQDNQTKRCPQCGYEYEPWVEICPDCGVLLEPAESQPEEAEEADAARSTVLEPGADPHWTVVTNAPNAIIGNLLKSQLEDVGIPVLMMRAPSADIAQFSGNDYVPYDLRVPRHRLADARLIIQGRPDRSEPSIYFRSALGLSAEETIDEDRPAPGEDPTNPNLPDGWRLLPTERDVRARQSLQRYHGEEYADAGWEDDYGDDAGEWHYIDRQAAPASSFAPVRSRARRDYEDEYEYDSYDGYDAATGRAKWIRVVYGILLAALSIPFIFQVLGQIASVFDFRK